MCSPNECNLITYGVFGVVLFCLSCLVVVLICNHKCNKIYEEP